MNENLLTRLDRLKGAGWKIELLSRSTELPAPIIERYGWLAQEVLDLVSTIRAAVNADETAWILSTADYHGTSASAFAWNEWERLSLSAADDDEKWKGEIRGFWDRNFPLVMSVKSGYAYFAVERATSAVVVGEEPQFEEPHRIATSVSEFFQMITKTDPGLSLWL